MPLLERRLRIRETHVGPDALSLIKDIEDLSHDYRWSGGQQYGQRFTWWSKEEALEKRILAIKERHFGSDRPEVIEPLTTLGVLSYWSGRFDEAEQRYKRALAIAEHATTIDRRTVPNLLGNLGHVYLSQERFAEAEAMFKRRIALRQAAGDESPRGLSGDLQGLGYAYRRQHKYVEAARTIEQILTYMNDYLGGDHPDMVPTLEDLAVVHKAMNRVEDADVVNRRIQRIRSEAESRNPQTKP